MSMTQEPPELPGAPYVLWAPNLAIASNAVFEPGLAIWNPHHRVWCHLIVGDPLSTGERYPDGAVQLTVSLDGS